MFKLLVKGTCEEKIFNAGNKKLGLGESRLLARWLDFCADEIAPADHLIIQRIDAKDESEDVEGILQVRSLVEQSAKSCS